MTTLFIATRNAHKVQEVQAILGPAYRCRSMRDVPEAPAAVEDGATFAENAQRKAECLARWLAKHRHELNVASAEDPVYVVADDSGLEVDALDGAPGVHSARFAALGGKEAQAGIPGHDNTPDAANNARLLELLHDVPAPKRTARFRCVLAVCRAGDPPGPVHFFEGVCEGRIGFTPRGHGGFGYDPLFVPDGYDLSFAELGEEIKNSLSHRARALAELKVWLAQQDNARSG